MPQMLTWSHMWDVSACTICINVVAVCVWGSRCPNDFVLHNFGNVPAPSSWLTVTASPTNCSLINYATLRTIKPFEFPISLYVLDLLNVVLVHKIIIAVRFAVVCHKITKISNTFISTHVCGNVLTANGPSDAGVVVVDVCIIVANTFINLRRLRIVTTWINRLANDVLSFLLSLSLSLIVQILYLAPISQVCWGTALCSLQPNCFELVSVHSHRNRSVVKGSIRLSDVWVCVSASRFGSASVIFGYLLVVSFD